MFKKDHLLRTVLIGLGVGILIVFLSILKLEWRVYVAISWVALILVLFIFGNRLIWRGLDKFLAWAKFMSVRFFIQLLVSVIFIMLIVNGSYFLLREILTNDPPTPEQVTAMNFFGVIIAVPVLSINFGLHFLKAWKQSELEAEQLQKENAKSELQSLKNHLDPHFLFNNLNILGALIDKDKELSKEFLNKFAEVYRSLLSSKGDELVALEDELNFLDTYLFLIRCRFGNNVSFIKCLDCDFSTYFVPPLTLQMLLENGIKHNIISDEKPLRFELSTTDDGYLIFGNNLQEKMNKGFSHGTGIDNIKQRYKHFTDKEVYVKKTDKVFEVHIPIVEVEEV